MILLEFTGIALELLFGDRDMGGVKSPKIRRGVKILNFQDP